MMKEEQVERRLKAELDFFKVYAVFVIGLATGEVNLLLREDVIDSLLIKVLFATGLVLLFVAFSFLIRSYFRIRKITKL